MSALRFITIPSLCYLYIRQELEAIKARVREMEEEAEKLKEMQSEVEKQMNLSSPTAAASGELISHMNSYILT